MTTRSDLMYAGYRFPGEVISCAVYLYSRALLSLRMVEEMLALRGIVISHETIPRMGTQVWPADRQSHPTTASGPRRHVEPRQGRH